MGSKKHARKAHQPNAHHSEPRQHRDEPGGGREASRGPRQLDVFISHAERDLPWAEWVAWHLHEDGMNVELGARDWRAGDNAVRRRTEAIERAERVVMLYSRAYFNGDPTDPRSDDGTASAGTHSGGTDSAGTDRGGDGATDEWTVLLANRSRIVPLRVEDVEPPATLRPYVHVDLFDLDETATVRALLTAVRGPEQDSDRGAEPPFPPDRRRRRPDGPGPRLPGALPDVWNVPPGYATFTGREPELAGLRERLRTQRTGVVQALHGMGGVGKTTLAIEYAHRFAGGYQLVWWIDAEHPERVGEQLAALGVDAQWFAAGLSTSRAVAMVRQRLRTEGGWLVVFDNAERPDELRRWLPQGPGHVLITSRNPAWGSLAKPVELDLFSRVESTALLREQAPELTGAEADKLAEALGDLPLAVAQAAALLTHTGMDADTYLRLLSEETADVLSYSEATGYEASLAAVVRISMERLTATDPDAARIARICALLAPEPVPLDIFTGVPPELAARLWERGGGRALAVHGSIELIGRYGLAKVGQGTLRMHRLTQAIIRDLLGAGRAAAVADAEAVMAAAHPRTAAASPAAASPAAASPASASPVAASPASVSPAPAAASAQAGAPGDSLDDGRIPARWPRWAQLLPHLLALDLVNTHNADLRRMACNATSYLFCRGDYRALRDVARRLYDGWRDRLGPDAHDALFAATNLANAYDRSGDIGSFHQLAQEIYARRLRLLGADHPDTLVSSGVLSQAMIKMGQVAEGHALTTERLAFARRVLGDDHRTTRLAMGDLAAALYLMGHADEAHQLYGELLTRTRRAYGEDDPETLNVIANIASLQADRGLAGEAIEPLEDVYVRSSRISGTDHPETLTIALELAVVRMKLRRYRPAHDLLTWVVDRCSHVLGADHPITIRAKVQFIGLLMTSGRRTPTSPDRLINDVVASVRRWPWAQEGDERVDPAVIESFVEILRNTGRRGQARTLEVLLDQRRRTDRAAPGEPEPEA
jgi:hypothetical protein